MKNHPVISWATVPLIAAIVCVFAGTGYTDGFDYQAGTCTGNCKDGKGKMIYNDGGTYDGLWKNGMWHGAGERVNAAGYKFIGKYSLGERVEGTMIYPNGMVYKGAYNKTLRHGKGVCTWPDGVSYAGEWKDDFINGKGIFSSPEQGKLEGTFREEGDADMVNFYGTVTWRHPDGTVFKGEVIWCPGAMMFFCKEKGALYDKSGKKVEDVVGSCCSGGMSH